MSLHWFFVSGTDTDVGKTLVASGLLKLANKRGLRTAAIKPVAAGCSLREGVLKNSDALQLQGACSYSLSYQQVNPIALRAPIAPHIAAEEDGIAFSAEELIDHCLTFTNLPVDTVIVEGAGGWRVPIGIEETMSDVAVGLSCQVILVVGMRLGCLNHAVLTREAICRDGLAIAGWVANILEPEMPRLQQNIATLNELFEEPCLGVVPRLADPTGDSAAVHLKLPDTLEF